MKRNRKAKILATLGPASSSSEVIDNIFNAGCDVFRLNFSHGSIETHRKNMMKKFEVKSSAELMCLATSKKWISFQASSENDAFA